MTDVLTKATKQGEEAGAKVATEAFKGLTLHIIQPPKPKDDKEDDPTPPPIVWTHDKSLFYIGTDVDAVKDLIAHAEGRDDSLAATESYAKAVKKLGADAQVVWFVDVDKALKLVVKAGAKGKNAAQRRAVRGDVQVLGLNGLKAAAGSFTLNAGNYDSVTQDLRPRPGPVQGLLKLFSMPKVSLKPEPWVPATVASYQTLSWDLDEAFNAINDLANMFQPGVLERPRAAARRPQRRRAAQLQEGHLRPARRPDHPDQRLQEADQRGQPADAPGRRPGGRQGVPGHPDQADRPGRRRPQEARVPGDDDLRLRAPRDAQRQRRDNVQFKGPVSLAIAKDTLFVSTEPTLLEQVLRGGGPALADSPAYQAVAKEIPDKVSSLTYVRPDEQARVSYDMIKSGQFEKALQGAAVAGGPDVSKLGKLIDKDKLPDFSVFAKYLSQGGGYSVMDDDGMTFTSFTLRKANP